MRGPTPRYKLSPTVRGTVAMSAEGVRKEEPEKEEHGDEEGGEMESAAAQAWGLSSLVIAAQPGWGSAAHEESGDERTGSQPNALRRAAHWVWNALTPKAVLDRRERRRSLPAPGDFGSLGGGWGGGSEEAGSLPSAGWSCLHPSPPPQRFPPP